MNIISKMAIAMASLASQNALWLSIVIAIGTATPHQLSASQVTQR